MNYTIKFTNICYQSKQNRRESGIQSQSVLHSKMFPNQISKQTNQTKNQKQQNIFFNWYIILHTYVVQCDTSIQYAMI
jgi:hypothetical protein